VATIASDIITEILAKKKLCENGNMITENSVVAGDSLFNEFKIRTKLCSAIN
jgi:hypothetical protein